MTHNDHTRRYRERWFTKDHPNMNCVHKRIEVLGEPAPGPDTPCFMCGARGECRHRVFA